MFGKKGLHFYSSYHTPRFLCSKSRSFSEAFLSFLSFLSGLGVDGLPSPAPVDVDADMALGLADFRYRVQTLPKLHIRHFLQSEENPIKINHKPSFETAKRRNLISAEFERLFTSTNLRYLLSTIFIETKVFVYVYVLVYLYFRNCPKNE